MISETPGRVGETWWNRTVVRRGDVTALYGLEIYYEGYKQFIRDGNDNRAEETYQEGDPYMDEAFDRVSKIRDKINKISCTS